MSSTPFPKHHQPNAVVLDEFDEGMPPVEPDEGRVPPFIADDPEHDRIVDPGDRPLLRGRSTGHPVEVALCP